MRIVVFGAGVIGRIYAARLMLAGHHVTIVSRGETARRLVDVGVTVALHGQPATQVFPTIVTNVRDADEADLAFVAVRRDQIEAVSAVIPSIRARIIVSLINLPLGLGDLRSSVGADRFVPAFPGVGGSIDSDGVVDFIDIRQQPTTIQAGPNTGEVTAALRSAGFRTAIVPDMTSWLQSHAVFVCAFESAIVDSGGDLASLASDRERVRTLVLDVRRGLRALAARGIRVEPRSLRLIFLHMPLWFAARYWMRQLAGPLGHLGFLPHSFASRDTELPALEQDVRLLTTSALPHPSQAGRSS